MCKVDAFLSLGSNMGSRVQMIQAALNLLSKDPYIELVAISKFYETTPVSTIPQNNFINAVCQIKTSLDPIALFDKIEHIESFLGKAKQTKECPRNIDIDLLFFADQEYHFKNLIIPHAKWKERLFVLIPLLDLKRQISVIMNNIKHVFDIQKMIQNFSNVNNEKVKIYENSYS